MSSRSNWRCVLLFGVLSTLLFAQSKPGDDYTFAAPAGYQVRNFPAAIEFSRIDQQRKFYCQLALYTSQASLGSTEKDADNEWNAVVVKQFRVRGQVTSKELPLPHAPGSVIRAAETTDGNGKPAITTLFVLRFPNRNRYVGLAFNVPNQTAFQACQDEATSLVGSIRMRETAVTAAPAPSTPAASGSPVGTWQRVTASAPAGRYNMITKQWEYSPAAAMLQFRQVRRFTFEAGGRYTWELDAEDYNRAERSRVVERGRYTVAAGGGILRFQPEELKDGKGPRKDASVTLTTKATPAAYERRFLIGEHPTFKDNAGLQLANQDGSWETYKPAGAQ